MALELFTQAALEVPTEHHLLIVDDDPEFGQALKSSPHSEFSIA